MLIFDLISNIIFLHRITINSDTICLENDNRREARIFKEDEYMSIEWSFDLNVELKNLLLGLVEGKALNLNEIARELSLNIRDYKDRQFLSQKIKTIKRNEKELAKLAYLRRGYTIVEFSEDMECLSLHNENTGKTYLRKARYWHDNSIGAKKKGNGYEGQITIESYKEGQQA